jgi:hypothetical protein
MQHVVQKSNMRCRDSLDHARNRFSIRAWPSEWIRIVRSSPRMYCRCISRRFDRSRQGLAEQWLPRVLTRVIDMVTCKEYGVSAGSPTGVDRTRLRSEKAISIFFAKE